MIEWFAPLLDIIQAGFALSGVAIITVGGIYALYHFCVACWSKKGKKHSVALAHIRSELGSSIVLGLDFLVAADVMETIVAPDYYELGLLGILVAIRIVLSYFLMREIETLPEQ